MPAGPVRVSVTAPLTPLASKRSKVPTTSLRLRHLLGASSSPHRASSARSAPNDTRSRASKAAVTCAAMSSNDWRVGSSLQQQPSMAHVETRTPRSTRHPQSAHAMVTSRVYVLASRARDREPTRVRQVPAWSNRPAPVRRDRHHPQTPNLSSPLSRGSCAAQHPQSNRQCPAVVSRSNRWPRSDFHLEGACCRCRHCRPGAVTTDCRITSSSWSYTADGSVRSASTPEIIFDLALPSFG